MDSDVRKLARQAQALLLQGGTTESTRGAGAIDAADLIQAVTETLRTVTPGAAHDGGDVPDDLHALAGSKAVARAQAALQNIRGGASPGNLSDEDISSLELIVLTVGRPALRYSNDRVETPPNSLGDNSRWVVLVTTQREKINGISSCVGRIACERGSTAPVLGTGWRLGRDFIVTNRHVASRLVVDRNASPDAWRIDANKAPFVDFAYTNDSSGPLRFNISALIYCASTDDIDLAILQVASGNAALPPAISIDWDKGSLGRELLKQTSPPVFQGEEIYAVGHPYLQSSTECTRTVFGQADGRKRWSPGLVTAIDSRKPILQHDSSTLGGNSGSCVISTRSKDHAAVGVHFGGRETDAQPGTGLGSTNYAIAFSQLGAHPAVQFLKQH